MSTPNNPDSRQRIAWPLAMAVADEVVAELRPHCEKVEVAGSLRRRSETVKDVEVLIIPKFGPQPTDMFGHRLGAPEDFAMSYLATALEAKDPYWRLRPSAVGGTSFGALNKLLLRRTRPGFPVEWLPVDVFTATAANWGRDLAVRTGPAAWNKAIATMVLKSGRHFHAYGPHAFSRGSETFDAPDEAAFFRWLGLPLLAPPDRTDAAAERLLV